MKAKSLNGHNLMLWLNGKVIALSRSCSLSLAAATGDSGTKDDGNWDSSEIMSRSWSMSNQSVDSADEDRSNDLVFDDLFDLFISDEPIDITFGIPTNASDAGVPDAGWTAPTGKGYAGQAHITALDRTGDKGSKSSISISLQGIGALEKLTTQS